MEVTVVEKAERPTVRLKLDLVEAGHLMSFLLHAKFADDVWMEIVGAPTMRSLLQGLLEAGRDAGADYGWWADDYRVDEVGGLSAPPAFLEIARWLREHVEDENFDNALVEALFPYVWGVRASSDQRFIRPGTMVSLPLLDDGEQRFGIVINCWPEVDEESYECHVAVVDEEPSSAAPVIERHKVADLLVGV